MLCGLPREPTCRLCSSFSRAPGNVAQIHLHHRQEETVTETRGQRWNKAALRQSCAEMQTLTDRNALSFNSGVSWRWVGGGGTGGVLGTAMDLFPANRSLAVPLRAEQPSSDVSIWFSLLRVISRLWQRASTTKPTLTVWLLRCLNSFIILPLPTSHSRLSV